MNNFGGGLVKAKERNFDLVKWLERKEKEENSGFVLSDTVFNFLNRIDKKDDVIRCFHWLKYGDMIYSHGELLIKLPYYETCDGAKKFILGDLIKGFPRSTIKFDFGKILNNSDGKTRDYLLRLLNRAENLTSDSL